jgi:hypothetical protein
MTVGAKGDKRGRITPAPHPGGLTPIHSANGLGEFLPHVRRQPGKKLLLCYNLACHTEVIDLCRKEDVEFVCLPANSTDKLQPLDVSIFGPMKTAWRKQLQKYGEQDPTAKLLMKMVFPGMLKELVESLNIKEHLP